MDSVRRSPLEKQFQITKSTLSSKTRWIHFQIKERGGNKQTLPEYRKTISCGKIWKELTGRLAEDTLFMT